MGFLVMQFITKYPARFLHYLSGGMNPRWQLLTLSATRVNFKLSRLNKIGRSYGPLERQQRHQPCPRPKENYTCFRRQWKSSENFTRRVVDASFLAHQRVVSTQDLSILRSLPYQSLDQ